MRTAAGVAVLTCSTLLIACSPGDDPGSAGDGTISNGSTTTVPAITDGSDETADTAPNQTGATAAPVGTSEAPVTTFAVVDVPETGVPGLDSDDAFCAAWSRFGGSWQVIQVAANFAPDLAVVPAMEVVASPVVDRAYDAMFAAWPQELADERDVVADGFFGPLGRRADVALDALARAGATDDDLDALAAAWEAALVARQPDDPVVTPELSDELSSIVLTATLDFDALLVGIVDDPSMRITVETPLTDAYLATACPDQGSLLGTEGV